MSDGFKAVAPANVFLDPLDTVVYKLLHPTALHAYQMIVVVGGNGALIVPVAIFRVDLADHPEMNEQRQRAVDGGTRDSMALALEMVYQLFGLEMPVDLRNGADDRQTLGRGPCSCALQCCFWLSLDVHGHLRVYLRLCLICEQITGNA